MEFVQRNSTFGALTANFGETPESRSPVYGSSDAVNNDVYKPLNQGLAAYDMNTGEKLWDVPVGQTPARIRNHPLLKGVDVPNTGGTGNSIQMVMGDLLVQTTEDLRGDAEVNEQGMPLLHARDKRTGKILVSVEIPIPGQYGMMTYLHEGKQYILVQAGSARRNQPASLVALTLP